MPRGFMRDNEMTQRARKMGVCVRPDQGAPWLRLKNAKSFLSLPKVTPHTQGEAKYHLILARDERDKGPVRAEIFRRNREAHGGLNRCVKCNTEVGEEERDVGEYYGLAPPRGHWHHIENGPGLRCDCPENGEVVCPSCHKEEHPRPMFGKAHPQRRQWLSWNDTARRWQLAKQNPAKPKPMPATNHFARTINANANQLSKVTMVGTPHDDADKHKSRKS